VSLRIVQPAGWASPKGYSNGVEAQGRLLFIAGQIGWDPVTCKVAKGFAAQFDQALRNVMDVLRAAGGEPGHLARVTLYVSNKRQYVAALKQVGASWRQHVGRHYPAMTLVEVKSLLEPGARVEIEATAVL